MSAKVPPHSATGDSTPTEEVKYDIPEDGLVQRAPSIIAPLDRTLVSGPPLRTDSVLGNWVLKVLGIRKKSEPEYDLDAVGDSWAKVYQGLRSADSHSRKSLGQREH